MKPCTQHMTDPVSVLRVEEGRTGHSGPVTVEVEGSERQITAGTETGNERVRVVLPAGERRRAPVPHQKVSSLILDSTAPPDAQIRSSDAQL